MTGGESLFIAQEDKIAEFGQIYRWHARHLRFKLRVLLPLMGKPDFVPTLSRFMKKSCMLCLWML
jgi:hypothetical protein